MPSSLDLKGRLIVVVVLALVALLLWDHTFDPKGWVPSLGANLITMLITVVVIDALFKQRQERAAATMLRTSFIDVGCELGSVADAYTFYAEPNPEYWWNRIIESWKRALDNLRRDLGYCAGDLDLSLRQKMRDLEGRAKTYSEMGWGDFHNENLITSKDVLETWHLVREVQRSLYPGDENMAELFGQVQDSIDKMAAKFKPYW
jgi:hypothetical protein